VFLGLGFSLFLGLFAWVSVVVLDLQKQLVFLPLCIGSFLLFPLWNQNLFLFLSGILAVLVWLYPGLGDGDAYLYILLGFTVSGSGLPLAYLFLPVCLGAAMQAILDKNEIAMAPYYFTVFILGWAWYFI